jgi:hypothetical protein
MGGIKTMRKASEMLNTRKLARMKPPLFSGHKRRASVSPKRAVIDNEYFEKGYASVFPNSVLGVYLVLAKHANHITQRCFPSAETFMALLGMKNRNTIFKALVILEEFGLIAVQHSKGYNSNYYLLLDPSVWKDPYSIDIDTLIKSRKRKGTVSNATPKPSQNIPENSSKPDTRIELKDSDKKISENSGKTSLKEGSAKAESVVNLTQEEVLGKLSAPVRGIISSCYSPEDIALAVGDILQTSPSERITIPKLAAALKARGAAAIKNLPPIWTSETMV